MFFRDIPGLQALKRTLLQSVQQQHIAHAQLFFGREGSAKLALALAYSQYLQCEDRQAEDACGRCAACVKMQKAIHPDFHAIFPVSSTTRVSKPKSADFMKEWRQVLAENTYLNLSDWLATIGAEGKQAQIGAEESRNIVGTLSLKAFEGQYKILLIWLPEYMNTVAANALLKILEEPPEDTVFLLVSNQPEQMLLTILSRVQQINVPDFEDADLRSYLSEQMGLESEKATQIAHLAEGNLRKARLLATEVEDDNHTRFRDWMRLCYMKNYTELVKWAEDFAASSKDAQKNLLYYGLNICREALVWQYAGEEMLRLEGNALEFVKGFAKVLHERNAEALYHYLNLALLHLERNANAKILFLDTSLKIAEVIKS